MIATTLRGLFPPSRTGSRGLLTCSDERLGLGVRLAHHAARLASRRSHVMGNAAPLVSVTFDDVPQSAATAGARILEDFGRRGTFYVATGLFGQPTASGLLAGEAAVAGLAERGHEIGLHTHAHRPLLRLDGPAFAADMAQSRRVLDAMVPQAPVRNFAYPFGFASPAHTRRLRSLVRSSRTAHPGINADAIDPHLLLSQMFDANMRQRAAFDRLLDETIRRNGWLVLTAHDVSTEPSPYGCTPDMLAYALERTARLGVEILPLDAALDRIGLPA